jgi:peptide deformylase
MTVRDIIQVLETGGDAAMEKILTQPARVVTDFDEYLHRLIGDLRDTMWRHEICVGLAAPQVGEDLRVAVVNWERGSRDDDLILINPIVMNTSGKKDLKRESCMSLWGLTGDVERRDKVSIRYADESGQQKSASFEGFGARAVQHEIDHLDGVLYRRRLKAEAELRPIDIFEKDTWRA